jgi:Zn-dependent protease
MLPTRNGSIRLFRLAGVDVFLHWSWFLAVYYLVGQNTTNYNAPFWKVAECLALFAIVLLHEFGHALACRSVGGHADQIVLWPLGGVAFVQPPPRPGAVLWSIAAGPLVNVLLVPLTLALLIGGGALGWAESSPDLARFTFVVFVINLSLLIFNLLPVYPLDGGQIVQTLLWFVVGRARSLLIVSVLGIGVAGVGAVLLLVYGQWWLTLLAVFAVLQSWNGLRQARLLSGRRHEDAACPSCGAAPLAGPFWGCGHCQTRFDTFDCRATCPGCGAHFADAVCPECRARHPLDAWYPATPTPTRYHELPYD